MRRWRPSAVSLAREDAAPEIEARDERPDEPAAALDRRQAIAAGLTALSPEHREVLELVFFQGLSLAEVAEVTKRTVGTVKSRLSYAKAQLRATLGRGGHRRGGRRERDPRGGPPAGRAPAHCRGDHRLTYSVSTRRMRLARGGIGSCSVVVFTTPSS